MVVGFLWFLFALIWNTFIKHLGKCQNHVGSFEPPLSFKCSICMFIVFEPRCWEGASFRHLLHEHSRWRLKVCTTTNSASLLNNHTNTHCHCVLCLRTRKAFRSRDHDWLILFDTDGHPFIPQTPHPLAFFQSEPLPWRPKSTDPGRRSDGVDHYTKTWACCAASLGPTTYECGRHCGRVCRGLIRSISQPHNASSPSRERNRNRVTPPRPRQCTTIKRAASPPTPRRPRIENPPTLNQAEMAGNVPVALISHQRYGSLRITVSSMDRARTKSVDRRWLGSCKTWNFVLVRPRSMAAESRASLLTRQ